DRYSFFAAGTHIQEALAIDDKWFGVLGVSFMIVYTIVSPVMGWMGDRYSRKMLLASGVGLWSLATVGTAFSADFYHMFFWRALLGLGEASYGAIAPALISDLFPIKARGRAMGVYYLALPLGTALGYILGGWIADKLGWKAVFFVVGLPGLLVALAGLFISDPGRGASEGGADPHRADRPRLRGYLILLRTPPFLFNTPRMAALPYPTGRRPLRDGRLCGLGVDILPARASTVGHRCRQVDRPALSRRRHLGHPPGHVPPGPAPQANPERLSPARRAGRAGRHPSGRRGHPRPRAQVLARVPVRG